MTALQARAGLLLLSLISAMVVGYSLYLEHYQSLSPCVLCLMQRYCTASIALLAFLASRRVDKSGWLAVMVIMVCFAILGVYFAGRQLWLHSLPPEAVPACMPSLDTLIHYFPWQSVIEAVFMGTGDCAHEQYHILGISLPAWGLFYFIAVILASSILIFLKRKTAPGF